MTEAIAIAIIAALATLGAAGISVAGSRNRLARIETISSILKDLPTHNEAYEPLAAVRLEDARELRRSQRSVLGVFIWTSVVGLLLSVAVSMYGAQILEWSIAAYLTLLVALLAATLLLVVLGLSVAVIYAVRFGRGIRGRLRERREARTATRAATIDD